MRILFLYMVFVFMVSCLTLCYFHKMEAELSEKIEKINDKHKKRMNHYKWGENH